MPAKKIDKQQNKPAETTLLGMPRKITEMLKTESDRGAILILGAYIEEILASLVSAKCVSEAEGASILEFRRPAGDFDSKIALSTAFGFISDDERRALNTLRKMRNAAAHFDKKGRGFDVLFDSTQTVHQVAALAEALNLRLDLRERAAVREGFIVSARLLALRLLLRVVASERPNPAPTLKERAAKARGILKDTLRGKQLEEAEKLAHQGKPEMLLTLFRDSVTAIQEAAKAAEANGTTANKGSTQPDTNIA